MPSSTKTMTTSGLFIMAIAAVISLALAPQPASEPGETITTPDEAIVALLAGNERYVKGKPIASNTPEARGALAAGQAPYAAIIRCADSRVSPEIVFDQSLGELFVCGVAGNIPTTEVIASLEFAVAVLGSKLIVVMGHSACGAVAAAIEHQKDTSGLPGSLPELVDQIVVPCAVGQPKDNENALNKAITCNANIGVTEILKRSSILADAVEEGKLRIIAGIQDLKSGRFTITRSK